MSFLVALSCPQCAAPLSRMARWRTVVCSHCGAAVLRNGQPTVERARFREAWLRSRPAISTPAEDDIVWHGQSFRILTSLGAGAHTRVLLAQRMGHPVWRVIFKLARHADDAGLNAQAAALTALRASLQPGAAHFVPRLPTLLGTGPVQHEGRRCAALVMRQTPGYWGSAADLQSLRPAGIDARHAVWIWRRLLETLGFVHASGWTHGDVSLDHALLHPRDHGVMLIGWSKAKALGAGGDDRARARDIAQSAWLVRALLAGSTVQAPPLGPSTPPALAALLRQCCEAPLQAASQSATTLATSLGEAARADFGPPRFVRFDPLTA
ncbi:protein kinase family protein [Xenophilus arseniciresistens]|uniref:Protein kinase family protein n=1 Tax=Xenophilus arseniciresistens TaxID=1283306 RepID=A0AAE3T2M5_9BURK|nr:protein kinase family protein [Xenophilus arseniciresistens]MDA7418567.1 protein kinase family protein [Xenophilus arseniciresistens]